MSLSLMNPAAAPFFFAAFEAIPETGGMMVPVQVNPLSSATEPRELTPQTAVPFARTLGVVISEINALFLADLVKLPLPGGWEAFHSGSKYLLFENHPEGKSLRFDRGGRLTEQLTGHTTGQALSVRRYGLFTSVDMAMAINLKHDLLWIPHFYDVKFEAYGVTALKRYLGLQPDTPLMETGLALFRSLGIDGGPAKPAAPGDQEIWSDPFQELSISAKLEEGATRINLFTGLDQATLMMGQLCETLALEVYPTDPQDQKLPSRLLALWRLAADLADQYRREDASSAALTTDYFRATRRIYGDVPFHSGPEDVN